MLEFIEQANIAEAASDQAYSILNFTDAGEPAFMYTASQIK
jgi:hypothetical protein